MKTTIDLPEGLVRRAKALAARRRTTLKELVTRGLDMVVQSGGDSTSNGKAMVSLESGLRLGGKPLSRDSVHVR